MRIVGIDPGCRKGGVGVVRDGLLGTADPLPVTDEGVDARALMDTVQGADAIYIEKVHAMPKQGVTSSFNFGRGFGAVCAVAEMSGARVVFVTPREWKTYFGLTGKTTAGKDGPRLLAIEMFPRLATDLKRKKDLDKAEALLIARYGFDMETGDKP